MGRVWAGECSGLSGRTGWDLRKDTGGPMLAGTLILPLAGVSQRDHGWQMRLALEQQLCRCGGIGTSGSPRLRGCSAASGSCGLLPHPPLYPWDGMWRGGPARVGRSSQGQEPACGLGWGNTSRPRKLKESPFKSAPPWALPPGRASPPPPGGQVVSGDGHRGTLR